MNAADVKISKRLSWLLRHGAGQAGLVMDQAGWSRVEDVLDALDLTAEQVRRAVDNNDKGRLQLDGARIRACQGHSTATMPVTHDALEATWELIEPDTAVWHGTRLAAIPGIARHGISSGERTHVHLAEHPDSRVGKRSAIDFLIKVSPQQLRRHGINLYRSPNGVILARHVPADSIILVLPASPQGETTLEDTRQALITAIRHDPPT